MARKCKFNTDWLSQHAWLEEDKNDKEKAKCKLCNSNFMISNKGYAGVKQHSDSQTHKKNEIAASKTVAINRLIQSKFYNLLICFNLSVYGKHFCNHHIEPSNDKTAAMEATFVYHLIKEGQSFRSATFETYG